MGAWEGFFAVALGFGSLAAGLAAFGGAGAPASSRVAELGLGIDVLAMAFADGARGFGACFSASAVAGAGGGATDSTGGRAKLLN